MSILRFFSALLLLYFSSTSLQAGALENGVTAFEQGQYQQALNHWQAPAKQNHPDALYNIGLLYMKGLGVKQDDVQAKNFFKEAARYGSVDAAYNLGVLYKAGRGGYPSNKDAVYWWRQAAEHGHADSQFNYAVMLAYGRGVKKDEAAAVALWMQAAEQGHAGAIQAMAQAYEQGLFGLPRNPEIARTWRAVIPSEH